MPGKKETDGFSLIDDVVEGFSDVVDGSIFDFDAEEATKEANGNGDRGVDGDAIGSNGGEDEKSKSKSKRPTVPGRVEGVSIRDASADPKEKGRVAEGKEKGGKDGDGNGDGTGNNVPTPSVK